MICISFDMQNCVVVSHDLLTLDDFNRKYHMPSFFTGLETP